MIDLGQTFYEQKQYFFNDLSVHQIVINPSIKGYPPVFMLCKEQRGTKWCEYILGANFVQLNKLLMTAMDNSTRLCLAERLAESLMPKKTTDNISVKKLLGRPLRLRGLDMTTILHRFNSETGTSPLYYFQLTEM
jgi:hypothetical protein